MRKLLLLEAERRLILTAATITSTQIYPVKADQVVKLAGLGRIVAERMRGVARSTNIIDNIGGASGSIGVGRLARAVPRDGQIMLRACEKGMA